MQCHVPYLVKYTPRELIFSTYFEPMNLKEAGIYLSDMKEKCCVISSLHLIRDIFEAGLYLRPGI
jgi:hypothetical protein